MSAGRRRGRPPGSVSLTPEIHQTIVNYILAGAYDYAAAEAAGVSARTFREWMARGEGTHPSRSSTPKLRRFARDVNQAKAQARVAAETTVYQQDPKYWLPRVARSKLGREGWTEPRPEEDSEEGPSLEDLIAAIDSPDSARAAMRTLERGPTLQERIVARELRRALDSITATCPDPNCPCTRHQGGDEE